jgi:hypothetical protein
MANIWTWSTSRAILDREHRIIWQMENLVQRHFVHHKFHMVSYWVESEPNHLTYGTAFKLWSSSLISTLLLRSVLAACTACIYRSAGRWKQRCSIRFSSIHLFVYLLADAMAWWPIAKSALLHQNNPYADTGMPESFLHREIRPSVWCSSMTHTHTHTQLGRTPLDEWSARRRDLYLTIHNTHKKQTAMPPAGFESTISAGKRLQTNALDRAATDT